MHGKFHHSPTIGRVNYPSIHFCPSWLNTHHQYNNNKWVFLRTVSPAWTDQHKEQLTEGGEVITACLHSWQKITKCQLSLVPPPPTNVEQDLNFVNFRMWNQDSLGKFYSFFFFFRLDQGHHWIQCHSLSAMYWIIH